MTPYLSEVYNEDDDHHHHVNNLS